MNHRTTSVPKVLLIDGLEEEGLQGRLDGAPGCVGQAVQFAFLTATHEDE